MATPFPFGSGNTLLASQLNAITTLPVSTKTASYVLTVADVGYRIVMNSASATTITVNTSIFGASDVVEIANIGAGVCTVTAGTCTVGTTGTLALAQNASGKLVFISASAAIFISGGVGLTSSGATVATTQTTTSTSYTDLATSGPAVTLTTGTTAYVIVTTYSYNATSGTATYMSFAVSGATTIAAGDATAVSLLGMKTGGQEWSNSAVYPVTLTAGSNTFTAKYKTSSGTGTFGNRSIIVIAA